MNRASHRTGVLYVSGSAVAWSLGGLFTRLIHVDSWTLLAWRGIFGAAGLAAVMPFLPEKRAWRTLRGMGWVGLLFVVQSAAGMTFYLTALRHTTVANVAVIYATAPFLAGAIGWWVLREKPAASAVIASATALGGVAVMVGFGARGGLQGDALALAMTATMAVTVVVARRFPDVPILLTACLSSLLSGLASWPLGAPLAISSHDLWLAALFGLLNFAVGLPLFTFGARRLPPIETALIGAIDAPLAPFWVWLALRETPGPATLVGGAVVFAAVALHLFMVERRSILCA
ncbi:MAG: DMT family transporter [Gammaproteobacteria bacterium]|nr:DMT family transporter [Gammaproteobacteria bacterium]